jgi:hypothetical protein
MTSLLKRIVQEKRRVVVPLGIAVVLNLAMYVLVVRPLAARSAGAADRAAAAARARTAAEAEYAAAQALVTGKTRADEELNAFYNKVLPASQSVANRMTYASLPALARRTNVRYERRNTSVAELEEAGLARLQIRMDLHGDWDRIREFIYQLESAPEFVIIDEVVLAQGESSDMQALSVSLSTYFRAPRPDGT